MLARTLARRCVPRAARAVGTSLKYEQFGAPETVIQQVDSTPSAAGEGQLQVEMIAAPMGPADIASVQYGAGARAPPATPGHEGVGVVKAVGKGVSGFSEGDYVVPAVPALGTWRASVTDSAAHFAKVPSDLPVEQLAQIGSVCMALRLLGDFVKLEKGDYVMQNGANGSVGHAVVQVAQRKGLKTMNVLRSRPDVTEWTELLRFAGAEVAITESTAMFPGSDVVFDDLPKPKLGLNCANGVYARAVSRRLDVGATMVTYGGPPGVPMKVATSSLVEQGLTLSGFNMARWLQTASAEQRQGMVDEAADLLRDGVQLLAQRWPCNKWDVALQYLRMPYNQRKPLLMFGDHYSEPRFDQERALTEDEIKAEREKMLEDVGRMY